MAPLRSLTKAERDTKTIQVWIPGELRDRAIAEANRQERSLSNFVRIVLRNYLDTRR